MIHTRVTASRLSRRRTFSAFLASPAVHSEHRFIFQRDCPSPTFSWTASVKVSAGAGNDLLSLQKPLFGHTCTSLITVEDEAVVRVLLTV